MRGMRSVAHLWSIGLLDLSIRRRGSGSDTSARGTRRLLARSGGANNTAVTAASASGARPGVKRASLRVGGPPHRPLGESTRQLS